MASPNEIKLIHDDLGELTFRRPRWADFAAWWDSLRRQREGDASHNLVTGCAVKPTAAELAAMFEDGYGFLPPAIADKLLDHVGATDGFHMPYPMMGMVEAEAAHVRAKELDALLSAAPALVPAGTDEERSREEDARAAQRATWEAERAALWLVSRDMMTAARKAARRPLFANTPAGIWALRAPGSGAAGAYTDGAMAFRRGSGSLAEVSRTLVLSCVLSPEPAVAAQQIDEYPYIAWTLVEQLKDAAGAGKELRGV